MNVGYFLAGNFNGDSKEDLVHTVAGSDYANVWTTLYYLGCAQVAGSAGLFLALQG
jgi:hypothetical protein